MSGFDPVICDVLGIEACISPGACAPSRRTQDRGQVVVLRYEREGDAGVPEANVF
jgi:hypothetical protein